MSAPTGNREPIAIIGMACRFPGGACSPEAFWNLLRTGTDAIIDVPPDRWDTRFFHSADRAVPGKTHVKQAGFLRESIADFDAALFGLPGHEARSMDPQQRLLLETAWRAAESAGIPTDQLRGSPTGVFVGGFCTDNLLQRLGVASRHLIDAFTATSSTLTLLANRISHLFDLRGPSISLDTACSSSLVAVHLACQSLWSGECRLAFAGGANVMLRPEYAIAMSKGHFLSSHARSMAFDERADGYARGEGAGMVLLKPLVAALKDGDPICAVIRMTGVNQDGQTPTITQPSSTAQEELIRNLYRQAGISGKEVDYIEAHGTGTQAGDLAELSSLNAVLSEGRSGTNPCVVGSVKTNIGHLEAAAGIAALIKAVLVLQHREAPANLHFQKLNSKVDPESLSLLFPTNPIPLSQGKARLIAGVNSFGYGGTNAHVLMESSPHLVQTSKDRQHCQHALLLLPVTAHTPSALRQRALSFASALEKAPENILADWLHSTSQRTSHLAERTVALGDSRSGLVASLRAFADGLPQTPWVAGRSAKRKSPVYVFSGMGPQWWGMGRELMKSEPVFNSAFRAAAVALDRHTGGSVLEELGENEASSKIGNAGVAQRALFAIQTALVELWRHWGIEPSAVVGHSAGEAAAAFACGALSLEAAAQVCAVRSRLQQSLSGRGKMLAVAMGEAEARERLVIHPEVWLAAINSPNSVTLAGSGDALEKFAGTLPDAVFRRMLQGDIPYHSPLMDEIEADLRRELANLRPCQSKVPFHSTVEGKPIPSGQLDASYWVQNVRKPVLFADACRSLGAADFRIFLEIGPHPVLGANIRESLETISEEIEVLASLRRKHPDNEQIRTSAAKLFTLGLSVNWKNLQAVEGGWTPMPGCPLEPQHLWLESEASMLDRVGTRGHPFAYRRVPGPAPAWEVELNENFFPYLDDHKLGGAIVFPGAAYIESALVAHQSLFGTVPCVLRNIRFEKLLRISTGAPPQLRIEASTVDRAWRIFSTLGGESRDWNLHAHGEFVHLAEIETGPQLDPGGLEETCDEEVKVDAIYNDLEKRGLKYGPWFRTIHRLRKTNGIALVHLKASGKPDQGAEDILHPTLLDGAFQALIALAGTDTGEKTFIPVGIQKIRCLGRIGSECLARISIREVGISRLVADMDLAAVSGETMVQIQGVTCQDLPSGQPESQQQKLQHFLSWSDAPEGTSVTPKSVLVTGGSSSLRKLVVHQLQCRTIRVKAETDDLEKDDILLALGQLETGTSHLQQAEKLGLWMLRTLRQKCTGQGFRLIAASHSAMKSGSRADSLSPAHSSWWGILPVARNEGLVSDWRIVELDLGDEELAAEQVVQECCLPATEQEIARQGARRFKRELRNATGQAGRNSRPLDPSGTYLITGGTRGFGLEIARWMGTEGVARLVLIGKSGRLTREAEATIKELEAAGTLVEIKAVDIGDAKQTRNLISEIAGFAQPLRGIIHGAMVLHDGFIKDLNEEEFKQVFRTKAGGAWNLHRWTQEQDLDFFVSLSSISSFIGNPGQAAYAASNAFLDGLAHYRRGHGLPAQSISLGLLSDTGVAKDLEDVRRLLETAGVLGLNKGEAIAGLNEAMGLNHAHAGLFRVDWKAWLNAFPSATSDSRLAVVQERSETATGDSNAGLQRILNLPIESRHAVLLAELRSKLGGFVKSGASGDPAKSAGSLAVDSLSVVEIVIRIRREFGVEVSAVEIIGNPELEQMAVLLLSKTTSASS